MELRDHVASFPYGQTWSMTYSDGTVVARKDHHTFTWRPGQGLVTGICIPGITLYSQSSSVGGAEDSGDPLATPDGTEAVYGADSAMIGGQLSNGNGSTFLLLMIGLGIGLAAPGLYALATQLGKPEQLSMNPSPTYRLWENTLTGTVWLYRVADEKVLRSFPSREVALKWCDAHGLDAF